MIECCISGGFLLVVKWNDCSDIFPVDGICQCVWFNSKI